MSESFFSPSNHGFEINKNDRSGVLNEPGNSASSSTAKLFATTTNKITKPGLFIPGRDNIKQSLKTGTFLVDWKFKIKQWKITKAKGTNFDDTSRCIKIRLGCLLQRGEFEKEDNLQINVLEFIAAEFEILTIAKAQSNIVIHLKIDNKTALSYLLKMRDKHNRNFLHISKYIWS